MNPETLKAMKRDTKLAELVSADKVPVETESLSVLIADYERLLASRRVHELDNHHNAIVCGYCNGPLKGELLRLQTETERQAAEIERLRLIEKSWSETFG
jgi:hypothetical protein